MPEIDPIALAKKLWPNVRFSREQRQIIDSVWTNDETVVPAAHQVGKDFVSGFIGLVYFLTHAPCRIITTTVSERQINVLWGEIGRFIQTSVEPLRVEDGGPLRYLSGKHQVRRTLHGDECPISYLWGFTCDDPETLAGHHAEHTMLIIDEASGVADIYYERACTWARKRLIIGNTYPCSNFFFRSTESGDILAQS